MSSLEEQSHKLQEQSADQDEQQTIYSSAARQQYVTPTVLALSPQASSCPEPEGEHLQIQFLDIGGFLNLADISSFLRVSRSAFGGRNVPIFAASTLANFSLARFCVGV